MRAENDDFLRLLVAANFTDNVFLLDGPANFVGHVKARTHFPWIGNNAARQPHGIFARDYRLRNPVDLTSERIRMPIEQQSFPSAHPQNGPRALFHGMLDNHRRPEAFVEEISPR